MLVGATDSPFLLQLHMGIPSPCTLGSPPAMVPSLQQRSPDISAWWSWVTVPIPGWCPFSMKLPGHPLVLKEIDIYCSLSEFTLELSGPTSVSPQHGVTWGLSSCCLEDLDILQLEGQ